MDVVNAEQVKLSPADVTIPLSRNGSPWRTLLSPVPFCHRLVSQKKLVPVRSWLSSAFQPIFAGKAA